MGKPGGKDGDCTPLSGLGYSLGMALVGEAQLEGVGVLDGGLLFPGSGRGEQKTGDIKWEGTYRH